MISPTCSRYLFREEKVLKMQEWKRKQNELLLNASSPQNGPAVEQLVGWLTRLNRLPGVCIVQFFAGRRCESGVDASGHLSLRLGDRISAVFDLRAFELASQTTHIEQVARVYSSTGQEITSITFAGRERELLQPSMDLIVMFFEDLEKTSSLHKTSGSGRRR